MTDIDPTEFAHLTGLQQLQLMAEGRFPAAPIAETVGFRLSGLEAGRVAFEGTPTLAVYNPIGGVHGGWIATLLDSACGCAVHSLLKPGQAYTTLELKTVFHRGLTAGIAVRAEGRIIQMGRRAAFTEADLKGVDDGRLYASATSTLLVMER